MASASVISNSLRNLSTFLQDHQVSFSNGLLILFTIGGEQIFRFNAFRCPCNHDEAFNYALIFMLAPALILGIIGKIYFKILIVSLIFHYICMLGGKKKSLVQFWFNLDFIIFYLNVCLPLLSLFLNVTFVTHEYHLQRKLKA